MNLIVLDIPRIYTGLAEWMACMLYVSQLRSRLPRKLFVPAALGTLVIQCGFLVATDRVATWLWVLFMGAAVVLMIGTILLLSAVDIRQAVYTGIRAFVLAEFAAALEWQIHSFFWPSGTEQWWKMYGLLLLIYGSVFSVVGIVERACVPERAGLRITSSELWNVVVMGIVIFAGSNLSFYMKNTPFSSSYAREIMNIRTLVDFSGLVLLYAYHIQRTKNQTVRELAALQAVLENQYAQYRMSRDTIDMINRKYHDLKHQITALRAETDPARRERWLNEMEEDIRAYETQNKTGNSVLDTVLTAKGLYCQKHGIALSVVADGNCLSGIDVMDICSLFGNALDNAIECELKIPDKSKRMIYLHLTNQKRFVMLRVENYCPEPPALYGNLPESTKSDRENHGFGLKSIRHTAEKYGGTMTVTTEDSWFVLKILIPCQN